MTDHAETTDATTPAMTETDIRLSALGMAVQAYCAGAGNGRIPEGLASVVPTAEAFLGFLRANWRATP